MIPIKPIIVAVQGENATSSITIEIPEPPQDIVACDNAIILSEGIPMVDSANRYGEWWLVASATGILGYNPDAPVHFYWARQISATEVGAVPTGVSTNLIDQNKPQNLKVNTGFAEVPYQWISRFEMFNPFPRMADEPCKPKN